MTEFHATGWRGPPRTRGEKGAPSPLKRRYSTVIGSSNVKMVADRYIHAAYHNKHWWQAFGIYQHRWPWTLKIGGFSEFFCDFRLRHAFQEWIAPKWLEIDQDNLRMKFSAWNVDFSSPSLDMLLIITSTGDELFRNFNINDVEWPCTLKIWVFSDFWQYLAAREWIATKWMEIDQDYLRIGTAKGSWSSHEH